MHKMMQLIMISAQRPVYFEGFGNILLTRETFKMVRFFIRINFEENSKSTFLEICLLTCSFFSQFQTVKGGFSYFLSLRQFDI